ncbi:MAG TPA: acyl-CoA dehydrogenase family protein, partial [Polyangiaceae bacterium]
EDSVSTSHPALVAHGCAAFSVESDQGEQLVIVQEVARSALRTLDTTAVIRAIRSVVSDHHALHTHAVVLLKPSTLPRTTSGKVRRKACRQAFLEKSLLSVASWVAPMGPSPMGFTDPYSERRESSSRADRLIEWLRRHAADLVASYASEERRSIPSSLLRDFAKQGLIGMQVEASYGGLGLGHSDTARVLEQLAAFDFALSLFVGLNNCLGIQPVAKYAPPEIRSLLLPGLIHGDELAAFAFEEPGSAKAPSGLAMQAKPDGEERWRLFGTKYLDGVATGASVISVFAHHEEPPGISAFVVSDRIDGLSHVRDGLSMGVLGFSRESVVLDGVRVGRENLLGSLGSGIEIAREAMMHTRLAIGAACVGGMKRCAQIVTRDGPYYGSINGKLTPNPVLLSRLGSVTARVAALECLVSRIARSIDENRAMPAEAFAACKILAPELLLRSIDDLMQLGGQGGYAETNRISSLYRDAGLLRNFDGPPEAVAELTGAVVMEEDASLRLLIDGVFGAPELVRWIDPVVDTIRQRMRHLTGALARRAQRWGHTRAGELAAWLTLLAAVEGSLRTARTPELERAHAWARAQFEYALSAVRYGTPSETATLDTSDLAATFAAYASTIGELDPDPASRDLTLSEFEPWQDARPKRGGPPLTPTQSGESSKRELRSWIISWLANRLQIPVSQVEVSRSFADHGIDSVAAVELAKSLSDELGRDLDTTVLWDFATI